MVMIHPPAFHVWKFLMKNMIPTNNGLSLVSAAHTHRIFMLHKVFQCAKIK